MSLKSLLLLAATGTALAQAQAPSTIAVVATNTSTATAAPVVTPANIHCDLTYCVNGTSYCHFWAGISTWYITGPWPGEVMTTLGACKGGKARITVQGRMAE